MPAGEAGAWPGLGKATVPPPPSCPQKLPSLIQTQRSRHRAPNVCLNITFAPKSGSKNSQFSQDLGFSDAASRFRLPCTEEKGRTAKLGAHPRNAPGPPRRPALLCSPCRALSGGRPRATAPLGSRAPRLPRQRLNACKFPAGCPGADWPAPRFGHRGAGGARARQGGGSSAPGALARRGGMGLV